MIMTTTRLSLHRLLVGLFLFVVLQLAHADSDERCGQWAELGECENNPGYMLQECSEACRAHEATRLAESKELEGLTFFDLEANDIDGNLVKFEQFRGKVTVITNVASYCGYTESHYKGLVQLYQDLPESVEILAFPCNQFGAQEPESNAEIKKFAEGKGVKFTMMEKINVNGPQASKVYKFLKSKAGPSTITWNFATYYVISPDGSVESHTGVEPMHLKDNVLNLVSKEEL